MGKTILLAVHEDNSRGFTHPFRTMNIKLKKGHPLKIRPTHTMGMASTLLISTKRLLYVCT